MALLADGHRWRTASLAAEAPEGLEGNVADAMTPYHAAEWHPQEQMVAILYCSPFVTVDRSSISMKLLLPEGNVSIGLVTSAPMPAEEFLDHYVIFRPSWNTKTYVQPASEPQGTGGTWREWFSGCLQKIQQLKPKLFGLRNSNSLKVVVNRLYDSEEDLFTWQATELWINGKRTGEALKSFTAGVDMPVRLFLYADDFILQLLEWPVVAQRCTERTGHRKCRATQLDSILVDRRHLCCSRDAEANDMIHTGSDHTSVMAQFVITASKKEVSPKTHSEKKNISTAESTKSQDNGKMRSVVLYTVFTHFTCTFRLLLNVDSTKNLR